MAGVLNTAPYCMHHETGVFCLVSGVLNTAPYYTMGQGCLVWWLVLWTPHHTAPSDRGIIFVWCSEYCTILHHETRVFSLVSDVLNTTLYYTMRPGCLVWCLMSWTPHHTAPWDRVNCLVCCLLFWTLHHTTPRDWGVWFLVFWTQHHTAPWVRGV